MLSMKSCSNNHDNTLETMKQKLDILKRIRFLQKSLIRMSFKHDECRSDIYLSLLGSLKLAKQHLYEINQLLLEE